MNGQIAIRAVGLRKAYGEVVALDGLDLEVRQGEIFGLIGANGSGKTTTVECLQGLRSPEAGTMEILGCDPATDWNTLRSKVGSQLQDSALPERLRVWEALDLFASLVPNPASCDLLMDEWGLTSKRNSAFADLSGGQRQRLFIALALVNNPELVFFDEMTTGLDPVARRSAWDLIEAVRQRGTTVVLVTHFMDEAEHLCDRLAVVRAGRVAACGTPAELIAANSTGVSVTFSTEVDDLSWLNAVAGVAEVSRRGNRVLVRGAGAVLVRTAAALVANGIEPVDLDIERPTLEDVYLALAAEAASPVGVRREG